jgi:hypothetical protein
MGGIHWNSDPIISATTTRRKTIFALNSRGAADEMTADGEKSNENPPASEGAATGGLAGTPA